MWSGSITNPQDAYSYLTSHYITKNVPFKFRGIDFSFSLSQGLFSSADIDSGTRLLLKVVSAVLDKNTVKDSHVKILDAGCGAGIIGICVSAAIRAQGKSVYARCQDRDELARLVTLYNAVQNHVPKEILDAFTEPLLAGPPEAGWDFIISNIPAKAGLPVLEDFIKRSIRLLNENGKCIIVAVHTLADFFRESISANGALIEHEEKESGHSVFVFSRTDKTKNNNDYAPIITGCGFIENYSFYHRALVEQTLDNFPMQIKTIYGAPGYDSQNAAETAVLKLLEKLVSYSKPTGKPVLNTAHPILIHEPGQGFFPCQLYAFLSHNQEFAKIAESQNWVFSGRNILSLLAAQYNFDRNTGRYCAIIPAVDLKLGATLLQRAAVKQNTETSMDSHPVNATNSFEMIIAFPELLPQSSLPKGICQFESLWESFKPLLLPNALVLAGLSSNEAERFDRKKPAGFTRLGNIKRGGFRAMGYVSC